MATHPFQNFMVRYGAGERIFSEGDLGTTMFTMVMLNSNIHPRRVYLFFIVMTMHDYGHTATLRNWIRWLRHAVRIERWRIPSLAEAR